MGIEVFGMGKSCMELVSEMGIGNEVELSGMKYRAVGNGMQLNPFFRIPLKWGHLDKLDTLGCPKHPVCVHYNPWHQDTSLTPTLSPPSRVSRLEIPPSHRFNEAVLHSLSGNSGSVTAVVESSQPHIVCVCVRPLTSKPFHLLSRTHTHLNK